MGGAFGYLKRAMPQGSRAILLYQGKTMKIGSSFGKIPRLQLGAGEGQVFRRIGSRKG
jgi:hypothetical protein